MKNPMDRPLEKRLSDRAVAIGRNGEVTAFDELLAGPTAYDIGQCAPAGSICLGQTGLAGRG